MILVTGATGQIGGEAARRLVADGKRVRVLARDPQKAASLGAAEVARGDLTQPDTVAAALAGVEAALLTAPARELPSIAAHFAPSAKRAGVRRLVLVSSATIHYRGAATAIARWHHEAEEHVRAAGLEWTMLRPGAFASNALRWAGSIRAQGVVYAPAGGRTAPIDPRDIGAVAAAALTDEKHAGRTHVLTGPELLTTADQVAKIGAAVGKPLKLVEVPDEQARAGMLRSGLDAEIADSILELVRAAREMAEPVFSTGVRDATGRDAGSFDAWARDHAAHFQ